MTIVDEGYVMCISGSNGIALRKVSYSSGPELQVSFAPTQTAGAQLWTGSQLLALSGNNGINVTTTGSGSSQTVQVSGLPLQNAIGDVQSQVSSAQDSLMTLQQKIDSLPQFASTNGTNTTVAYYKLGRWTAPVGGHMLKLNIVACGWTYRSLIGSTQFYQPFDVTALLHTEDGSAAVPTTGSYFSNAFGYAWGVWGYAGPQGLFLAPDPSGSAYDIYLQSQNLPGHIMCTATTTGLWSNGISGPLTSLPAVYVPIQIVPVQTPMSNSVNYRRSPANMPFAVYP
jgi:hypothetical protein